MQIHADRREKTSVTSFDNAAITGSLSVLYGSNRLVGGTRYVPLYSAGT